MRLSSSEKILSRVVLCFILAANFCYLLVFSIQSMCWNFIVLQGRDYESFLLFGKNISGWKEILNDITLVISIISFAYVIVLGIMFAMGMCSIKKYIINTFLFYLSQVTVVYFLFVFFSFIAMPGGIDVVLHLSWRPMRWMFTVLFGIIGFVRTRKYASNDKIDTEVWLQKVPLRITVVFGSMGVILSISMFIMYNDVSAMFYLQMALAILGILYIIVYGIYYLLKPFSLKEFLFEVMCFFMSQAWITWLLQVLFDPMLKTFALDRLIYTPFHYVRLGLIILFVFFGFICEKCRKRVLCN